MTVVFLDVVREVHQIKSEVLEPQPLIVVEDDLDSLLIHLVTQVVGPLPQVTLLFIIFISGCGCLKGLPNKYMQLKYT